ncbi:DUF2933 domain-containing protein [Paraburkholderia fungorum]|uniref:DUF2933 domain-containing protein n=1 Tax=Paraburkholderia fungorum TaxID=134537 RepID=A0A3R7F470_9BURK|nr:DUF2933 domain-containing protein [Paraburkholderia fungorum]RKF35749.1 hypothetical protein BCY88_08915 [Paraburkholderia fungorum]
MKCTKTMLATGAGLLGVLAVAYIAFPQFQSLVLSLGPYLLFLLCPLSMLFMMKGMNSSRGHRDESGSSTARESERRPAGRD